MQRTEPLTVLQVVAVRYIGSRPAVGDERALDAYAAAGVYGAAGVPYTVVEPGFPEAQRGEDEAANVGLLCGAIAEAVAEARRAGRAVLMTGGNCSHAPGVLGGLQEAHGPAARIGLVWFDAHADFNTPHTTLTGSLGGMPVAVCAGLALAQWREPAGMAAPLPTDRIVLVGPRNLDAAEEQLLRATGTVLAAPARGFPGADFARSIAQLAGRCDLLSLHIDVDILDRSLVPNHRTGEPNGPDMAQVQAAVDTVMATGKVAAFALVSVYGAGEGSAISAASGTALLRAGLASWRRYGAPAPAERQEPFQFLDPGPLVDGDLELVLEETRPADPARGHCPAYLFGMVLAGSSERVGSISFRVGNPLHLVLYGGHIGFGVEPGHRGHHYAARACRLLLPLARRHDLRAVWITCNPDNIASRRTCELAGAEFVEILDLPPDTDMARRGERVKCRYRIDLV